MTYAGRNLSAVRRALGLKQEYFKKYNIEQSRLSNWERGKRPVDTYEILEFCQEYDVSLDYIFFGRLADLKPSVRTKVEDALAGRLPDPDA